MQRAMGWRHALADTANFDRGLEPVDGDPVLDMSALRELTPYGLVAMACLAAHNDRLLARTKVVPPTDPVATAELMAAGFSFVVREFLCPVAGPPLPLPSAGDGGPRIGRGAEPLAIGSLPSGPLAYGPLAAGTPGRRSPVVEAPAVTLRPVHDRFEEAAVAEAVSAALARSATLERVNVVVDALRILGENSRRHAGAFDAYVAAALLHGGRHGPCVELAVGDGGIGLRAAVTGRWAPVAGNGIGTPPPADDGATLDLLLGTEGRGLADLARRITEHGGTFIARSGGARHTVTGTGVMRAKVPWMQGTIMAVSVPTGVPPVAGPAPTGYRVRQAEGVAGGALVDAG